MSIKKTYGYQVVSPEEKDLAPIIDYRTRPSHSLAPTRMLKIKDFIVSKGGFGYSDDEAMELWESKFANKGYECRKVILQFAEDN